VVNFARELVSAAGPEGGMQEKTPDLSFNCTAGPLIPHTGIFFPAGEGIGWADFYNNLISKHLQIGIYLVTNKVLPNKRPILIKILPYQI